MGQTPRTWRVRPLARALRIVFPLGLLGLGACADIEPRPPRDPFATLRAPDTVPSPSGVPLTQSPLDPARPAQAPRNARGFVVRRAPDRVLSRPDQAQPVPGNEITLNLQNADLPSVVRLIMEDGLQANYVIDPAVQGSVTLFSNAPLRPEQLLPTLEEILRQNNAAVVLRDGVYRIVPRAEVGLSPPLLDSRAIRQRGLVATVTPLRFVTANDVAEVLDSFSPVAGAIRYDRTRNLVFVVGSSAEQRTVQTLLETLDVNYFAGRSFALHALKEAEPDAVVQELTALFARQTGDPNPAIRFLPVDRIGAVLIIADQETLMRDALSLARSLDQSVEDAPRLAVFPVANRRAEAIAATLGQIFNVTVAASAQTPGLAQRTSEGETGDAQDGGGGGGADDETSSETADTTATGTSSALAGGGDGGVSRIVADSASNSIIALATPDGVASIESALRKLDVQPLQVMIEATLVEVALNETLEYGVRWFLQRGNFSFGFNDVVNVATGAFLPGLNAAFGTNDVQATISALDAVTDVRVLSSPTLMVLDNQVARLQVGDQVPITTRSAQSTTDPDAPLVTETEFRDTGVILEIKPSVNASGLVVLQIRQEISNVQAQSGETNPSFAQRVVESTVAVQSGQTVAIAGLIEEGSTVSRDGIPVLSRIPILGAAFGASLQSGNRSEFLVMIRPIIVRDQSDAQAATRELRRQLENLAPRRQPAR